MDADIYKQRRKSGLCVSCQLDLKKCGHKDPVPARCMDCRSEFRSKSYNKSSSYGTLKRKVLKHYGKVCACCGEWRFAFLQIDHVNNDGAEHRRSMGDKRGGNLYRWLVRNGYPNDGRFQVLCANCNSAKGAHGVCPHVKERERADSNGTGS